MSRILKSRGIEFSDFLPSEDPDLYLVPFNDLTLVAGWSGGLYVKGIKEIVLYREEQIVVGIELVYILNNSKNSPRITHGKKTKTLNRIDVGEKEHITAAFVGVQNNLIQSLRFAKSHRETGQVGIVGTSAPSGLEYSAAFGEIAAFRGTKIKGDEGRLVTLGVQTRFVGA